MSGAKKREGSSRRTAAAESSEVDEMIRAAEDEFLIGLRVGSHTISSSLDPDLARRFQALQSPCPSRQRNFANPSAQPWALQTDQICGDPKEEDLLARFAALKGDVSSVPQSRTVPAADPFSNRDDYGEEDSEDGEGGDGVSKEVEKVMRWAMDAARLDPSRNDDDDEHGKENDEDEEDDEELESEEEEKNKVRRKGKPGKWYSLFR